MLRDVACAVTIASILAMGCGGDDGGPGGAGETSLTVTVDPDGQGGERAATRTITCGAGSYGRECAFLEDVPLEAFEPVPPRTVCTQIFGGPQTARVTGTVRGERIEARFSRENGCEIARWDRLAPLLGGR